MSVNLTKGQKVSLTKSTEPKKVTVGLGWDVAKKLFGGRIDLDAHAYLLDENDRLVSHVYYRNLSTQGVKHSGDNLTGAGDGDDEQIVVSLGELKANVAKVKFVIKIFDAESRGQTFDKVKNAFIRVFSEQGEMCKYNLTDDYSGKTVLVAGEIYRHGDEWKFSAIGEGYRHEREFDSTIR